jgi:hypothetical protein
MIRFRKFRMNIQYAIATMLILGGVVTVWIGPDVAGEKPDGTSGPVAPEKRFWVRAFGIGCVVCGMALLVATLLGFRGEPLRELPAP